MNTMTSQNARESIDQLAANTAKAADRAIESGREAGARAVEAAHEGVSTLREKIPSVLGEKAAEVERLARAGIERARASCSRAREHVDAAGQRTVAYVREEPVKAVLIAAASGAVLAGAISLLTRSRRS
jgi:ElaB/YqjD/DUF883 family membrane-anchored ribosome-binding protein